MNIGLEFDGFMFNFVNEKKSAPLKCSMCPTFLFFEKV
jgi:hypothetical protein